MKDNDWVFAVPPGVQVVEELEARGISYDAFAAAAGSEFADREAFEGGRTIITVEGAQKIGEFFGMDPCLWVRLEQSFRASFKPAAR